MAAITICSDFGAQQSKSDTVSTVSPSICHEVMGPCLEPAWRIPPMAKVMRKRPDGQRRDQASRGPPSRASTPKPESVCLTILCLSPTLLTLTGAYPRPTFSGENQLRALANKSPGQERNITNQTPSVSILACLAGLSRLLQLHI